MTMFLDKASYCRGCHVFPFYDVAHLTFSFFSYSSHVKICNSIAMENISSARRRRRNKCTNSGQQVYSIYTQPNLYHIAQELEPVINRNDIYVSAIFFSRSIIDTHYILLIQYHKKHPKTGQL